MIRTFKNKDTKSVFERKIVRRWSNIIETALKRLEILNAAKSLEELKVFPSNRLHKLQGDRKNQYSISINLQYRICFEWIEGNAYNVEINNHYE